MPRRDRRRQSRNGPCKTIRFEAPLVLDPETKRRNDWFANKLREDVQEQKRVARLTYKERLHQTGRL